MSKTPSSPVFLRIDWLTNPFLISNLFLCLSGQRSPSTPLPMYSYTYFEASSCYLISRLYVFFSPSEFITTSQNKFISLILSIDSMSLRIHALTLQSLKPLSLSFAVNCILKL